MLRIFLIKMKKENKWSKSPHSRKIFIKILNLLISIKKIKIIIYVLKKIKNIFIYFKFKTYIELNCLNKIFLNIIFKNTNFC